LPDLDVSSLAERARAHGRLGIDTEFVPEGRYRPLLCLVQIVVGEEIVMLDPIGGEILGGLASGGQVTPSGTPGFDPAPLAAVLADPEVEVVLHAGRQDVALLRRCWDTDVTAVFDTQVAAGFAGFSAQAGYLGLLHDVLRIRLSKSASFTRWDQRPLTGEQLSYAAEDVEHLLALTDDLQARLEARGRLEWAREECRPIAAATDERDAGEVWRRLPRASGLDPHERAVARELAMWRERTAEREDRPVGSVLRDPSVVELAKRQPTDSGGLANIRGIAPDVARRRGKDIVAAIERGRHAEPIALASEERLATESGDGPVIALAESLVRTRALEAGLAYELVAARADLSPVVVAVRRGLDPPPVRTLQGWRRELVGNELLALLSGDRTLSVSAGRVAVASG